MTTSIEKNREKLAALEYEDEYVGNPVTRNKYPRAFTNVEDFVQKYMDAPTNYREDFSTVENTDAGSQTQGDLSGLRRSIYKHKGDLFHDREDFEDYLKGLILAAKLGKTPPTIIGVHTDPRTKKRSHYLLGGNTRAMIHSYLGLPAPVKYVPLLGPKVDVPRMEVTELVNIVYNPFLLQHYRYLAGIQESFQDPTIISKWDRDQEAIISTLQGALSELEQTASSQGFETQYSWVDPPHYSDRWEAPHYIHKAIKLLVRNLMYFHASGREVRKTSKLSYLVQAADKLDKACQLAYNVLSNQKELIGKEGPEIGLSWYYKTEIMPLIVKMQDLLQSVRRITAVY